jgi:hypothetical protein
MLVVWQVLAFTACSLLDLAPMTEVHCRFDVPLAVIAPAPPPPEPAEPPAHQSADPASPPVSGS